MTTREYHADGIEFALKVLTEFAENAAPNKIRIVNAQKHLTTAAKFLRDEQNAIRVLIGDELDGDW